MLRLVLLPTLLLLASLVASRGDPPAGDQTAPVTIKLEDCKATRRGKLTDEDLREPGKFFEKLRREGWPKEELVKRGRLEIDGHKYTLYLPKAKSYSVKNTKSSDNHHENTSTLISVAQDGKEHPTDDDGWFANLPLRLGDKMFDVIEIAADGSRIVLRPSRAPLRGAIVGRRCPSFSFPTADGKTMTREGLAGKVVVLDIWSVT
jgi:hypothetical protein